MADLGLGEHLKGKCKTQERGKHEGVYRVKSKGKTVLKPSQVDRRKLEGKDT